jgi:hypothetical protein
VRHTKKFEPLLRPGKGWLCGDFAYAQSRCEIGQDGHIEQERFLKNYGHAAAQLKNIARGRRDPVQFDGARDRLLEQGEGQKESGFPRSIRADEGDGLSLIQGEIIDVENFPGGVYTPQIPGNEHWFQN